MNGYLENGAHVLIKNKIADRLLLYILLFSGMVTLIITSMQLSIEYKRDVSILDKQFLRIEKSYTKQIAESLWFFNQKALNVHLEGISSLEDIEYLELVGDGEIHITAGEKLSAHTVEKHIPIVYISDNVHRKLGELTIIASMSNVYSRLKERLIIVLVSQTIKTFLVSTFIFLLFQYVVIKHLVVIDKYLKEYNLQKKPHPLELERKHNNRKDELDQMVFSINETSQQLAESYQFLEQKVEERTRELQHALDEVQKLSGLLPFCSFCKKVRDDNGYWKQIDAYIQEHSEADISHSICPKCAEKHYPGMGLYTEDRSG